MSEHWKSTPKYWCKHCACYVRDTRLERQNHEATARHQGAIKRSLRNLHYAHEREERDKARAQQEIARLNGVVTQAKPQPPTRAPQPAASTEAELQKQREQLAELGVAVPSTFRPDMAMAGEWTVTSSRVVAGHDDGGAGAEAVATGVKRRDEATEEQRDEDEAMERLFKRPRKWGRDSKTTARDTEDAELDALLSGTPIMLKKRGGDGAVDDDDDYDGTRVKKDGVRVKKDGARVKKEDDDDGARSKPYDDDDDETRVKKEDDGAQCQKEDDDGPRVKQEAGDTPLVGPVKREADDSTQAAGKEAASVLGSETAPAVVFKKPKAKAKGMRTK